MKAMVPPFTLTAVGAILALAACNSKPPTQAANCTGDDCAREGGSDTASEERQEEAMKSKGGDEPSGGSSGSSGSSGGSTSSGDGSSGGEKVPYDKEAVDAVMNRAARQVKDNCGSVTEDDGKRVGPYGTAKLSIRLGRNGHVKDVTVPDPYAGKAVGRCAQQAFERVTFPPYSASSDVTIERDVEIVPPKGK